MKTNKIIRIIVTVIVIGVASVGFVLYKSAQPIPEKGRIISATMEDGEKLTMKMTLKSINDSTAITRTYTAKAFNDFPEQKKEKALRYVSGNMEGDMPAIEMKKGEVFRPHFYKGETQVTPDKAPNIKAIVYVNSVMPPASDKKNLVDKTIKYNGELKSDEDGYYFDFLDLADIKELDNMNSTLITLEYEIKGEKFVSLTAVNLTTLK